MPRQPRRKSHSGTYHCMMRGINKQDIFLEEKDYLEFQNILKKTQKEFLYQLYSYVLMPNHIHLEIKVENQNLSQSVHSILTIYAKYFNRKYDRTGHVFENRFLSKNVENSSYLLNLVRYIHQNPLKARISKMEQYKWSSYQEYFKKEKIEKENQICNTKEVLRLFSKDKEQVLQEFLNFNKEVVTFQESDELLEYEMKNKLTDEEVIYFMKEKLGIVNVQEIQKYKVNYRNEIIYKLKMMKGITQPQIVRITRN